MITTSVAAVVLPPQGGETPATVQGIEGQSRPPEELFVARSLADLAGVLGKAAEPRWVWLLDAGVVPQPEALEKLLAATTTLPVPTLVASRVLAPDGSLDPASRAVAEVHRGDLVLAALARQSVALRVARRGSLLIRSETAAQLEPTEILERDVVWTARVLGHELGLLVPSSLAIRTTAASAQVVGPGTALRALRELAPRERAWFAVHFAEQAAAGWRSRLRHALR